MQYELTSGKGRTKVSLLARIMGEDIVVFIYNDNAHIGAVALAEYDRKEKRTSTSVITRLGHKDDAIAQNSAYLISKATRKPACVITGVHLDNINEREIVELTKNSTKLIEELISRL